jgi:integrase
MPAFKFGVRRLPPVPVAGQIDYWDESLPSFGMRVSKGGTRTWVVMYRYNATKRRMKIGNYKTKSLADARDEVIRKADKGADPASERKVQRARMDTVEDLALLYLERHAKKKKRSWKTDERILNREVLPRIGPKRVVDVTRQDIRDVLKPIIDRDALIRANHTLEVVRKMFNWAIAEMDLVITNPAAKIVKPGEVKSRGRFLSPDELRLFWRALTEERLGLEGEAAFKILLFTAQREMEVLRMRWEDIDEQDFLWTIPADHAKNELEHVVPLTPSVLVQLGQLRNKRDREAGLEAGQPHPRRTGYVFSSPKTPGEHVRRVFIEKRIIKVREATGIADITVHDLRRTATTYFGKVKVPQHIKKKILNHTKRKKSDVTEIYDRFEYIAEKRDALIKWEKFVAATVGEDFDTDGIYDALMADVDNVVPIGRARA